MGINTSHVHTGVTGRGRGKDEVGPTNEAPTEQQDAPALVKTAHIFLQLTDGEKMDKTFKSFGQSVEYLNSREWEIVSPAERAKNAIEKDKEDTIVNVPSDNTEGGQK